MPARCASAWRAGCPPRRQRAERDTDTLIDEIRRALKPMIPRCHRKRGVYRRLVNVMVTECWCLRRGRPGLLPGPRRRALSL